MSFPIRLHYLQKFTRMRELLRCSFSSLMRCVKPLIKIETVNTKAKLASPFLKLNQMSEISKRRTFAIISHPDAGKTTVTEKLLLYGGAIKTAGSVKARKADTHATSDWMEMEKERGISVTSSVMQFPYDNHVINLLDTPGHEDFSEDTYRTLTAVDSALMVIDLPRELNKEQSN